MRGMILSVALLSVAQACRNGTPSAPRPSAELTGTPAPQGPYDIVDLGTPGQNSSAHAINNRGWIVGNTGTPDGSHAALWVDGVMQDLGTLGGRFAAAEAINDAGAAVGRSTTADGAVH